MLCNQTFMWATVNLVNEETGSVPTKFKQAEIVQPESSKSLSTLSSINLNYQPQMAPNRRAITIKYRHTTLDTREVGT